AYSLKGCVTLRNVRESREYRKERKKSEIGIWRKYARLLFKAKLPWFWLIFLILLNVGANTLTLLFPQYAQKITAGVLTNAVIFGAVAVILGDVLSSGIVRFFGKLTIYKVNISYRSLIWQRLMKSPIKLYDRIKPNEMVSRTANDTSTIGEVIGGLLPSLVGAIYSVGFIIQALFGYDWRLGLGLILYTPVFIFFNIWYGKWSFRTNRQTHNRLASLTQFLSELLVSVPLIKSFNTEKKEDNRGRENLQYYYKANMKRSLINWIQTPLMGILSLVMDLFVIIFGIYLVSQGAITIDIWIAFFMYVGIYFGLLESFSVMYIQLKMSQGATTRIAILVEGDLEQYERSQSLPTTKTDLVFDNVQFGYGETPVLKDLSFRVPTGKLTAIVGPSGGGKSTVLSLIQQL